MSGRIYLVRDDDSLTPLEERPYDTEDLLQTLLERYPDLLAGEQMDETSPRRWLLIAREMGIPDQEGGGGRWALDHLFLDQDGVPTLVEVKRSSDGRIRREVVGQMMDYAANAVAYWPVEGLRSRFEGSRGSDGQDAAADLAAHLGVADDHNELDDLVESFWSRVKTNLQAGKIRLVFVADEIPSELRRIVEFMNEQMDPAEVLAIEVKQYVGEATRTLVPKLVGQTAAAQQRKAVRPKGKQWDEKRFFARLEEEAGAEAVRVARDIHDWIRPVVTRIWFGRGAEMGSLVPTLDIAGGQEKGGSNVHFFAIWTNGTVETYFQYLKTKPPFDEEANRRELLRRLNEIDGIQLSDDVIDKRPPIPLTTLASPAALVKFKDTIQWGLAMVREHS